FEKNFNEREAKEWMQENWHKSIFFAAGYLILIFGLQHLMRERRAFQLRVPLVLWSLSLALFSAIGAFRVWKHMAWVLSTKGFKYSVCTRSFYIHPSTKLWAYLFVLSKLLELGDTVFIVLRKKKLIFLHWFHHTTTLVVAWYSYKEMVAGGTWPGTLNFSIHTIMYLYYTMRAAGFQVPRGISMAITMSQVLQILIYVILNVFIIFWKDDKVCHTTWTVVLLTSVLYASILVLFCNFFFQTYLRTTQKSK
ncbi:ELOV6 protein, partial [Bucco capensis]|nr:ELOV6 protein [Bucco capensis]